MTVLVPLTKGYQAIIDDEDADRVLALKWQVLITKRAIYGAHSLRTPEGKFKKILLHRFILPTPQEVDHRDNNGLNCTRNNLRSCCTHQQNMCNKQRQRGSNFPYKGIQQNKFGSFCARIRANGKDTRSKWVKTVEDAARAYDVLALFYHGEFAHLNFPNDIQSLEQHPARDVTQISGYGAPTPQPDPAYLPKKYLRSVGNRGDKQ
jgi:hypothetical protein